MIDDCALYIVKGRNGSRGKQVHLALSVHTIKLT